MHTDIAHFENFHSKIESVLTVTLESKINKFRVIQGGRGVLPYISHIGIGATQKGRGLKTGIDFAHFSLVLRELRKRKELSIASIPADIERMIICAFEMNFKKIFLLAF